MKHVIRKSFTFEAAHQLESAYTEACSDCIHGHSYTVEMFINGFSMNEDYMVVDFGELGPFKQRVMEEWDHGLLLHINKKPHYDPLIKQGLLKASKVHFFNNNPTAELFAKMLFMRLTLYIEDLLAHRPQQLNDVSVAKVRVHETSTGYAEYGQGA